MAWLVPVSANPIEWDKNRTYQGMEFVEYEGRYYICNCNELPAGVDIHDEHYWVYLGTEHPYTDIFREIAAECEPIYEKVKADLNR